MRKLRWGKEGRDKHCVITNQQDKTQGSFHKFRYLQLKVFCSWQVSGPTLTQGEEKGDEGKSRSQDTASPSWTQNHGGHLPSREEYSRIMEKARWMGDVCTTNLPWRRVKSRQGWTSHVNMSSTWEENGTWDCGDKELDPPWRLERLVQLLATFEGCFKMYILQIWCFALFLATGCSPRMQGCSSEWWLLDYHVTTRASSSSFRVHCGANLWYLVL